LIEALMGAFLLAALMAALLPLVRAASTTQSRLLSEQGFEQTPAYVLRALSSAFGEATGIQLPSTRVLVIYIGRDSGANPIAVDSSGGPLDDRYAVACFSADKRLLFHRGAYPELLANQAALTSCDPLYPGWSSLTGMGVFVSTGSFTRGLPATEVRAAMDLSCGGAAARARHFESSFAYGSAL
jgi:hypothetical protein